MEAVSTIFILTPMLSLQQAQNHLFKTAKIPPTKQAKPPKIKFNIDLLLNMLYN